MKNKKIISFLSAMAVINSVSYAPLRDADFAADASINITSVEPDFVGAEPIVAGNCGANGDNVKYTIYDNGDIIISGKGEMNPDFYSLPSILKIKNAVIQSGITSVPQNLFNGCENLVSVTIPDTVTSIGKYAFYNCHSLTSIKIPYSVTSIGKEAFYFCKSLKTAVLPKNMTAIPERMFYMCSSLTSIELPSTITSIGFASFRGCISLKSITIPAMVKTIEDEAFFESGLTSLVLPVGVESVGYNALNCDELTSITIPYTASFSQFNDLLDCEKLTDIYFNGTKKQWRERNYSYDSFENVTIHYNIVASSGKCGENLTWVSDDKGNLTISGTGPMTDYNSYLFGDESKVSPFLDLAVTNVVIENGVTSVGKNAFEECNEIVSVSIPDSVTVLKAYAFDLCSGLTSFVIPENVTTIEDAVFRGCENLKNITIPKSLEFIGDEAFKNTPWLLAQQSQNPLVIINNIVVDGEKCSGELVIPDGITKIGNHAFSSNDALTSVVIPDTVKTIEEYAFYGCDNLTDVYFSGTKEQWDKIVIESDNSLFYDTYLHFESPATSGTWGDNITWRLTDDGTLVISGTGKMKSANYTDGSPFINLAVEKVIIEKGITNIGSFIFENCETINSIEFSEDVTEIGSAAFRGCKNLKTLSSLENITTMQNCVFQDCDSLTSISLPNLKDTSISQYTFSWCDNLVSVTLPNTIVEIGDHAFYGSKKLSEISSLDNVKKVGTDAFDNTQWLENKKDFFSLVKLNGILIHGKDCKVDLSDVFTYKVTEIGPGAFRYNNEITSIGLPEGITKISADAFKGCENLKNITFPDSLKEIEIGTGVGKTYSNINGVESVNINGGTPFENTQWLADRRAENPLVIVNGILIDGINCTGDVVIPDNVKTISKYTFVCNENLTSITIPSTVKRIDSSFVYNCEGEIDIYFDGTKAQWNEIASEYAVSSKNVTIHYLKDVVTTTATKPATTTTTTITTASTSTTATTTTIPDVTIDTAKVGDVDGDGIINATDASEILKVYALASTGDASLLTESFKKLADVNKDGTADAADSSAILAYYAYISTGGAGSVEEYFNTTS